ncbi:MAG: septal ring lytic transglycosylase RlpA family protein [Deltaproteobacteria bacterium]|nr:septal ring lytic transglycosylase RlpA family protein [Candidatus Zymogenaceae bacterium]
MTSKTRIVMYICFAVCLVISLSGCAAYDIAVRYWPEDTTPESTITPVPTEVVDTFEGVASWYGPKFHGKKTASGEVFDMYDLTAAHNTLPMGTLCVVTNKNTDESVTVRINDRGPFVKDRVIDLSYAAAKVIGMIDTGTAPVYVEVLGSEETVPGYETASTPPPDIYGEEVEGLTYTIQVGSFTDRTNAENLQSMLMDMFTDVRVEEFATTGTTYYRVRVGLFASRIDALNTAEELTSAGYDGFIVEAGR